MASAMVNRASSRTFKSVSGALGTRFYAKVATGTDIVSAAPNVSLQKARTWDEGIASKFSTTPLKDIFKVPLLPFLFSLCHSNFQTPFLFFSLIANAPFFLHVSGQESCHIWAPSKFMCKGCLFGVCVIVL